MPILHQLPSVCPQVERRHGGVEISAKDNPAFLVEVYSGSAAASALGRVVSIGDPCTRALVDLTDQGYSVVGRGAGIYASRR